MARAVKRYNLRALNRSKTNDVNSDSGKRSNGNSVQKQIVETKHIKTKVRKSKLPVVTSGTTESEVAKKGVAKTSKERRFTGIKFEENANAADESAGARVHSASNKRSNARQVDKIAEIRDVKTKARKSKRPIQNSATSESKIAKVAETVKKGPITAIKLEENVSKKYVGAHVSIVGGLHMAISNALAIGAKSFGLFLRSQRQWASKPLTAEAAAIFRQACEEHNFSPHLILPHGSYLLNCGSPDEETLKKSRDALIDELKRCEMLGLTLFNFHPGSSCGKITVEECLDRIAESINMAHAETKYVITVVENMSKQGHTVGGDFKELCGIIDRVKDKSRIGVCLDTCHAFAAGYNLATEKGFSEMMTDFENIIGLKYLKALHINDSMGKVGCHLDRHENIGKGHIGLKGFKLVMNDHRFNNLPMILETPANIDDSAEIETLYKLCT